jgi:integrase
VAHYLKRWLEDAMKPNVRPSTYWRSEQAVRLHLIPEIGQVRLAKLTPHDVQGMLNRKQASGLSGRGVQCIHAVLRAALNQAVRWGELQRNVAKLVKTPRATHRLVDPFTPEEARRFLGAIEGDRLEALYVLAIASGLRQGEILGLRWEDVDLAEARLKVRHALQRLDGEYVLVEPKTAQSRRTIALPGIVVDALRAHRIRQAEERLSAETPWTPLDLVFTTERGSRLTTACSTTCSSASSRTPGCDHNGSMICVTAAPPDSSCRACTHVWSWRPWATPRSA